MHNKFEIHFFLKDASLEKACDLASRIADIADACPAGYGEDSCGTTEDIKNLHYMLEYFRLNFELVPRNK